VLSGLHVRAQHPGGILPLRELSHSMRLAAFIRENTESIAEEWERFAATLRPRGAFSSSVLRDDISGMLANIADNMDQEQSAAEQQIKSEGEPDRSRYTEGAIVQHVVSRVAMGLSYRQFVSEFRALRATVIRLWQRDIDETDSASLDDLIRFNEAIDLVLTEGTVNYTEEVDRSRELFLGILGHDLRNPLTAISALAELQLRAKTQEQHSEYSSRILVSARRMSHMISDLLELARVRLGSGITLHRAPVCLRRICEDVVAEMQAVHPNRVFRTDGDETVSGVWDADRLSQVISNLAGNAVQHGAFDSSVTLTAKRRGAGAEVSVHNYGTPIPPDMIPKLFDSFYRLEEAANDHSGSLGLGLYISKEIIAAHGGTIEVHSSVEDGTRFAIRLPAT
jgi:signal transduction histidine kinase